MRASARKQRASSAPECVCGAAGATLEFIMVFVLDNYDSFTYNLVQYLGELGAEVVVRRNDEVTPEEVEAMKPERILLSPGPCTPHEAGILVPLIRHMAGKAPILGVCLGHQAIGEAFGGKVVRAQTLMHGKTSAVEHDGKGIFSSLPTPLTCTRYHSLIVEQKSLPAELAVTAHTHEAQRIRLRRVGHKRRICHHGPAPSQLACRGCAVPSRERAHRGRPPDDPQLSGHVIDACHDEARLNVSRAACLCSLCRARLLCIVETALCCWPSPRHFSRRPASAQNPMAPSTPTATPARANAAAPAPSTPAAGPSQPPAASDAAPTFTTPPVAIVPLDKSIPGAALSVDGRLQAWNGRAYLTGSGTITAGDATAQVTLPYRGTMHVCASSSVKLASRSRAPPQALRRAMRQRSAGPVDCARSRRGGDELRGQHRARAECRHAAHSLLPHHDRRPERGGCKGAARRQWRHLRG